ncbi:type II toxin-antitoxin system CcdA family antitoxin [Streptomyces sp. enrichment culture]|uniref:type II toxin-antitoxin system CcdA family antitoxin n=1 Tax=Streptomyces sp. enrichment culture TaxID=1795815 RepID=UPI003F56E268
MPKINVYVPDALAERIKAVGISVSPVCQRALEEEVRRMEAQQKASAELLEVAARLRATRHDSVLDGEKGARGYETGLDWARNTATYEELSEMAGLGTHGWTVLPILGQHSMVPLLREEGYPQDAHGGFELSVQDPWVRGMVTACGDVWREVEPVI